MNKHRRRKAKARRREAKIRRSLIDAGTSLGRDMAKMIDQTVLDTLLPMPNPYCFCHACRGIHCLIYHPGHDHRYAWLDITVGNVQI
jgi:hypothetical protein